ncbi:MAG: hypothetical protein ACE5IM_01120 [Nitrospinota bacterium]
MKVSAGKSRTLLDQPMAVEIEILQEKASALGRTGAKLRACVERIRRIEAEWTGRPEDLRRAEDYRQAVERASLYRYYLIVQREAVALTAHADVDRLYPIPSL